MQKFSLALQKIFEGYLMISSKSFRNQSFYGKMSLHKGGKKLHNGLWSEWIETKYQSYSRVRTLRLESLLYFQGFGVPAISYSLLSDSDDLFSVVYKCYNINGSIDIHTLELSVYAARKPWNFLINQWQYDNRKPK